MARLAIRNWKGADAVADTDFAALRERLQAMVGEAVDQVERAWSEAPSASDAKAAAGARVEQVRDSRAIETLAGLAATAAPVVAGFARRQVNRRNARHAAKALPLVVRAHPVLMGATIAAGALVGVELLRRRHLASNGATERRLQRRADARRSSLATGFDLDEEVARMEGEGGDPGAYDGGQPALSGSVRTGNGNGSGTR